MKNFLYFLLLAVLPLCGAGTFNAAAHPGSGIVVDSEGNVFFQDSVARTIWKIDPQGKLTAHHDKMGGHWMALDAKGAFAGTPLKLVDRIKPNLIVADGGAPITVSPDGRLYYGLRLPFAPEFAKAIEKLGITGLASSTDGTIYAACLTAVYKISPDGSFRPLVNAVEIKDTDADLPHCFLRGLDVDVRGNVYAAACGSRCVVKISADGKTERVLKAERPWSPTGAAVHGTDIYVLEYTNANGAAADGWLPRVRKLAKDGTVTTLASISEQQQQAQPNRMATGKK
jgi:sugar lactone lactonase YvrE